MLKRLRLKLALIILLIVTVMLCVIFGVIIHSTSVKMEDESLRMMRVVAVGPAGGPGFRPEEPPEEVRLPFFVVEVLADGALEASGGGYYDLSDKSFLWELVRRVEEEGRAVGVLSEYDLRFCRADGPGMRVVFADISSERSAIGHLLRNCLIIGLLSLLAFWPVSLALAGWAVRPVERAFAEQRQFVADASHELKTPLTVIMTNAELLAGGTCGEAERLSLSSGILAVARQMRSLTEGLLELARVDGGAVRATFERVDWSGVVSDALLPFEPVFFERGMTLESRVEEGLFVRGDALRLRQVVEALLDNAQKYGAAGGVEVVLRRQGARGCLFSLRSEGSPISAEDLENIFKRFYRVDRARTASGSYGLGLSIARAVVEEHGGRIWAESDGEGNVFFLQLPLERT